MDVIKKKGKGVETESCQIYLMQRKLKTKLKLQHLFP